MNTAARIRRRRATALVSLGARLFAAFFLVAALALLVLSRTHPKLVDKLRAGADTMLAPVLTAASKPIAFFEDIGGDIASYFAVRTRNVELEEKLEDFTTLERTLERLAAENRLLREQLQVTAWPAKILATGRVVGAGGGPFLRSVLIDAGRQAGVGPDAAVVDKSGVVGRTISVGPISARVLLLTDLNSRIPIRVERTGETGILVGDNSPQPQIQFLPLNASVQLGDRIVTSGHGGLFPPDLPVGFVSLRDSNFLRVTPFAALSKLSFLTVVTLPEEDIAPPKTLEVEAP